MNTPKRLFLMVVFVSALGSSVLASEEREDARNRRTMTVQGEGKVQAVPDMATLTVEVSQDGETLDPVQSRVRAAMAKILETVKAQGIDDKDVQTDFYNVRPKWEYDKRSNPRPVGFTVTNRVSVKVHDLKKVGKVLTAVTSAGATTVSGPNFEVDRPEGYQRRALALAYEDAHAKAMALADAAGVKLGPIFSMSPGSVTWPQPRPLMMRAMAAPAAAEGQEPMATGEQTLNATVTVVYALQ